MADEIIADGVATHPQMGVSVGGSAGSTSATGDGAVLSAVAPGGPADDAGLRAGDVVVRVGERTVTDADSLIVAVRSADPGQSVEVTYRRSGQESTVDVVLGRAPAS